jgi:hypothetical protein
VPEGGVGGKIVAEQILVAWHGNKLIFPISEQANLHQLANFSLDFQAKPLAEKPHNHDTEIHYYGEFLAQLDGQVAYEPEEANHGHYLVLVRF